MGQTAEDHIEAVPVGQVRGVGREHELGVGHGQARVQVGRPAARLAVAGGHHHLHLGVTREKPEQLGAGEP